MPWRPPIVNAPLAPRLQPIQPPVVNQPLQPLPQPVGNPAPWQAPGAPAQPVGGPVGFQPPQAPIASPIINPPQPIQGQVPPPQQVPNIYSQLMRPQQRMVF
jgi:hypothetical protein